MEFTSGEWRVGDGVCLVGGVWENVEFMRDGWEVEGMSLLSSFADCGNNEL